MKQERQYYVYIMTNKFNRVLYTGVTNDLERRTVQHKEREYKGFTSKYNASKLVYYEVTGDIRSAIDREKQIKKWSHKKKRILVTSMNPKWKELSGEWQ